MVLRAQLSHSSYAQAVADLDLIFPKDNLFHYRGLILITWLFFWITFYPVFSTRIKLDQLRIGIRNKFLLFFLISSILPAIPLSFFVRDYLHEFRETLIDSVSREGIKFLRYIDEQSILEKTQRIKMINDGIAELVPNLKQNGMQVGPLDSLRKILSPVSAALFVVASSSPRVFGKAGISCNGILEEKIAHEETRTEDYISQSNAVGWILRSVIANANGVSMEKKDQLKLEVFFETIGMSEPEVFIQKFYQDLEKIWEFGFGSFAYPCYVKFLSFSDKGKFDYGLLFAFDEPSLQEKYINGSYVDFNRNLGEYRLSAAHRLGRTWPENIMENPQFRTVFNSISPVNTSLNKLMSINGEEYLVQALQGNKSDFLKLVSLYPISRIDEQVNSKFRFLFWLWLASSLMSAGFSIFLARTISEPVKVLTKGVIAMGNRDFSQRLPDLGSDEFGHLGRVFNQTLADLEELQVAGFVQEKLLYQMEMPLKKGSVQIYGKTLSLNDLGGDYFDIVETENKTGILVGDVAGHGVAASLIMAFVKVSVINNETLYDQPAVFLNRLNSLFRATRSKKQRKFMSFQYILFTQDGNFSYINAGHCFPILVDTKKQTTTFLKMINSPLGTTSKEFTEVQHHLLEPGQAVVLYSDGYYEAGDLGIEKFQELLLQSYSQDPQQFYSQFKTAFNQALKNPELNDDMTLVIITA